MYYIPNLKKSFTNLKDFQETISKSNDFIELFKILKLDDKVVFNGNEILLQYTYRFKEGVDQKPLFYISIDQEGNIKETFCAMCYGPTCHHRLKLATDVLNELNSHFKDENWINKRKEYIAIKVDEEKQRLYQEEQELMRKKSLMKVDSLLSALNNSDILPLSDLVSIEPILSFEKDIFLSLKVGIDKMYNVQNCSAFIEDVIKENEHTYGKNLSFRHTLSSFDERSYRLLEMLLRNYKQFGKDKYNNREVVINKEIAEAIFTLYKGQNIIIDNLNNSQNSDAFFIRLDKVELNFRLSKNYNLEIENIDDAFILDCPNKSFYIKDKQIDLVSFPNSKLKPLYKFVKENKDFSFNLIKDVFTKEILSRYYEWIEIDEEIKAEIELKEFTIESYFDYDEEKIILSNKYFYDNRPIDNKDIKDNKYTSLKFDRYNNILRSIGVEDGIISEPGKLFQFLKMDLSNLKEIASVFLSERLSKIQTKTYKPFKMNLSYQTGMLSVCFNESSYTDDELTKIIKGIRKKVKYIKLHKNVILEIDDENAEKLVNTIDEFNLDINALSVPQIVPLYQTLKLKDENLSIIDHEQTTNLSNLINDIANYKQAQFEIPIELQSIMRSYQKEAFMWMKTLIKYGFSGILADDMGLGKTLEMISVILSDELSAPSLIVCPKSLIYNWKNEFELWAPNLCTKTIIGNGIERKNIILSIDNQKRCIYITSYDSLRIDNEYYTDKKFNYMILDEAQFIKNHETLKAQSVKVINAVNRFVLTGTPIENTVIDLWSIFDFLMPGYLYNISKFRSKYESSIIEKRDVASINNLVHRVTPFILRRIKKDVITDLPDKINMIQTAKMTDEQRKIYEAELMRTKNLLETSENKIELLACLMRLRQVCVDPKMYIENYDGGSGKVSLVLELIEDYIGNGHRILIFSQFTTIFKTIESELRQRNIKYYIITGKTNAEDRVSLATDFNNNETIKVFLVSLKAGGTGLNLVGADVVIHLDPWWNIAAENQATDRSHRIGQEKVVHVIKLICEDSIEQKVIELQERKKEIIKLLVADDDSNIQKLSNDDINFLLTT